MTSDSHPLVVHVVYRFDTGGLENGIVNLINHLPADRFRHRILSLTESVPSFRSRVQTDNVAYTDLAKPPGHAIKLYPRLYRLFREWRPDIVHTRNLAALETVVPAFLAGVPVRIHGEHGWDSFDREGTSAKYRWVRRLYRPFVTRYVALSGHIRDYLIDRVGIDPGRIEHICNGVDTDRFHPSSGQTDRFGDDPFSDPRLTLIGTVGRLQSVKNPLNLIAAFDWLVCDQPNLKESVRLLMIGDGPLRATLEEEAARRHLDGLVWFAGDRRDIPEIMRTLDLFVLPSNSEGISNTILEAMASGLPVVATRVGGNPELVRDGVTGTLVPPEDPVSLGQAIGAYLKNRPRMVQHGAAGRERALSELSIATMISAYSRLYESRLALRSSRHDQSLQ
jgi:sugar transferase (PEP-CTERM/EpsH1 system associated)